MPPSPSADSAPGFCSRFLQGVGDFAQGGWKKPEVLLMLLSASVPISFATWSSLLNNFAIERAGFTGAEMGILQSLREVPGFLAFTFVFVLLVLREQSLSLLSISLMGFGTALTGLFPSVWGLYATTVLMSIGFHYNETALQSLSLQWLTKEEAPRVMGRIISAGAFSSLIAYSLIWIIMRVMVLDYAVMYMASGAITVAISLIAWRAYPKIEAKVPQRKSLLLRQRYWLFYALTFFGGARRQIFMVFAGFMMVERFHYSVADITGLFLINQLINLFFAPAIGRMIGRLGERRTLLIEQSGLVLVFLGYALVQDEHAAGALYVCDNLFFALSIAIRTYFQKIADPADIAPSSGVSFSINHVAAVIIPAAFGQVWIKDPSLVFIFGAALAGCALLLSRLVPLHPGPGHETTLARPAPQPAE